MSHVLHAPHKKNHNLIAFLKKKTFLVITTQYFPFQFSNHDFKNGRVFLEKKVQKTCKPIDINFVSCCFSLTFSKQSRWSECKVNFTVNNILRKGWVHNNTKSTSNLLNILSEHYKVLCFLNK